MVFIATFQTTFILKHSKIKLLYYLNLKNYTLKQQPQKNGK